MRERLVAKAGEFRRPKLFTLTVDRRRFPGGPQEAHQFISEGRYVARLLRLLGVPLWAWVLEFQTKTGEGWPHWHILIDLARCPKGRIDLKRAWALWRDTWHLGGLDLSDKDRKFKDPTHAIHYITKYLIKQPEGGYPEWVLNTHGVKFIGSCRSLGPLVGDENQPFKPKPDPDNKREYPPRRPFLKRTARCGLTSRVFLRTIDQQTGETSMRWLGDLPAKPEDLVRANLPGRFKFNARLDPDSRVTISAAGILTRQDVRDLHDFMTEMGAVHIQDDRSEYNENRLLEANAFRQRRAAAEGQGTSTVVAGLKSRAEG